MVWNLITRLYECDLCGAKFFFRANADHHRFMAHSEKNGKKVANEDHELGKKTFQQMDRAADC